jgi:hypothetical protein
MHSLAVCITKRAWQNLVGLFAVLLLPECICLQTSLLQPLLLLIAGSCYRCC